MLAVPLALGITLRVRDHQPLGPWLVTLTAFWFAGYLAFNAASWWLKAAPIRRREARAPLLTFATVAAACGLATLALTSPAILLWAPAFAVALIPALVLAARRRERATLGGLLTTAAASLMLLVVRFPDPRQAFTGVRPASPVPVHVEPYLGSDGCQALALAVLTFAYFFGTVLYVKTNIRERASRGFYVASVAWHAAAAVLAWSLGRPGGALLPGRALDWTLLFALATARAVVVPKLPRRLTPLHLGLIEIVFCLGIIAIVAFG